MKRALKAGTVRKKRISRRQKACGWVLIAAGALVMCVGVLGYLAQDLQIAAFSEWMSQVYRAREAAQSGGTAITGAFDTHGDESGMHIYAAAFREGQGADEQTDRLAADSFEPGETKKALKSDTLQIPATKDKLNLVIDEESPVTLDDGTVAARSFKIRHAGTSKYDSLKLTVSGPAELTVWATSSFPGEARRMVLYNANNGSEVAEAFAPAAGGTVAALTFRIPDKGTYYLTCKGDIPIALVSTLLCMAILIFLLGLVMIFNGVMMLNQSWEAMKDLFCVEPVLVFFLLFVYYPVIDLIRISFTNMGILTTNEQEFVGWANYNWLFNQSGANYFWESLRITGVYMFWEVVITLVGGMLLALLFNRMTRFFNAMRSVMFMPKYIAVSTSAVVFIWILYSPVATGANQSEGILNYALSLFGITGPHWLIDASTALSGILMLTGWRVVGYGMMIYLSAMQGIPSDYYEAATIDGADGFQRFRFITMPLLAPTTLFLFVTTFIASMKVFQSVDVMTGGGPGTATNVMVQWIYNLTFRDFRTARGAAVSLVFFLILLVCTAATMRFSNRSVNYDS